MIHVGIIGCGYWGPNLLRNFHFLPNSRVRRICDSREDRLSMLKDLYPGVGVTTDYEKMFEEKNLDAIVIATPVRYHYEMAKRSLESGKHTFIEKPMASSVNECMELIELARRKNLVLMVGHTFVYTPAVVKIREIINSGELGQLYYINSQRLNLGLFQKDINVAWDLAPHDISIILHIIDSLPTWVNCIGKANIHPGIEDITNIVINFENGGLAIVQSSWLDPNKIRKMTFVGSKKMLVYDDTEPLEKIKIYDKSVESPPYYYSFGDFQYAYHYGDMYSPYLKQEEPLRVECQHFLDCIETGNKSCSSGEEGLKVVQVLEAATKSLKAGGTAVPITGQA